MNDLERTSIPAVAVFSPNVVTGLLGIDAEALAETRAAKKLLMYRLAENLDRFEPSGRY